MLGLAEEDDYDQIAKLSKAVEATSRNKTITNTNMLFYLISPEQEWSRDKIEEAYVQANLFAKDLRSFRGLDRESQSELQDYCIKLCKLARGYYQEKGPRLAA